MSWLPNRRRFWLFHKPRPRMRSDRFGTRWYPSRTSKTTSISFKIRLHGILSVSMLAALQESWHNHPSSSQFRGKSKKSCFGMSNYIKIIRENIQNKGDDLISLRNFIMWIFVCHFRLCLTNKNTTLSRKNHSCFEKTYRKKEKHTFARIAVCDLSAT